ncbi:ATP phosphoribosyltransferase [Candidatus Daviesbacteria bacterium]|nr:ATP phosphoribosyltransferase [Candidatus Daviesbacteria bacterium]
MAASELTTEQEFKIGIQKKGHLADATLSLLRRRGFMFDNPTNGGLSLRVSNKTARLILLRDDDIPPLVASGILQLGIVGSDLTDEIKASPEPQAESSIIVFEPALEIGRCRLAVGVPIDSSLSQLAELEGGTVTTKYPYTFAEELRRRRGGLPEEFRVSVVRLHGSVEVGPQLVDTYPTAVVDIVNSGRTMAENRLRIITTLRQYSAVLIGIDPNNLEPNRRKTYRHLVNSITGTEINGHIRGGNLVKPIESGSERFGTGYEMFDNV